NAVPLPTLEQELHDLGRPIGERILDLMSYREKGNSPACSSGKRYIQIVDMLHFIKDQIFKSLFGRAADNIE
ncbi:MAG: hypothetical protein ACKO96_24280, partial [Flammeovirgaceae bacterium]